jgi:hypothetical protein
MQLTEGMFLGLRRQRKRALGIRPGLSTTRRSSGGLGARGHGPDCAAIAEPVECRILDAAAKARGVKLGGPKLAEARKAAVERNVANANQHAANVLPVIREIKRSGASLHQIADALNARGIATARGGRWSHLHWASHDEAAESTDTPRFLGPSRIPPPKARPLKILRILR